MSGEQDRVLAWLRDVVVSQESRSSDGEECKDRGLFIAQPPFSSSGLLKSLV